MIWSYKTKIETLIESCRVETLIKLYLKNKKKGTLALSWPSIKKEVKQWVTRKSEK